MPLFCKGVVHVQGRTCTGQSPISMRTRPDLSPIRPEIPIPFTKVRSFYGMWDTESMSQTFWKNTCDDSSSISSSILNVLQ